MSKLLRAHADAIVRRAIAAVQPDAAVRRALSGQTLTGRVVLVAAGKAAWQMAQAALNCPGVRVDEGIVVTKYGHARGALANCVCIEAGHPVPDAQSFRGAQAALALVRPLGADDTVLFLLSGGASALFELPLIAPEELQELTAQLLASGADIVEMNTVRKRLSAVKAGRFAQACAPARVVSVVLSDVLDDRLDLIASGPAWPDETTAEQALAVCEKYSLHLSARARQSLLQPTPRALSNVTAQITGSVRELTRAAAGACRALGYEPVVLTDRLTCQAREAGSFLAAVARTHAQDGRNLAFLAGGETVVRVTGHGLGGRNQELALAAADGLSGLDAAVFSVGSDGTDGPTDAAGGYVDGETAQALAQAGLCAYDALEENDAYHALAAVDGLLMTGPTGTNVNDVAVALVRGAAESLAPDGA